MASMMQFRFKLLLAVIIVDILNCCSGRGGKLAEHKIDNCKNRQLTGLTGRFSWMRTRLSHVASHDWS